MAKQRHLIKRLHVEIRADSQQEARRIQTLVGRMYRRSMLTVLDALCTDLTESDQIIRIDRLELDLGTIDAEAFGMLFADRFRRVMRQELQAQVQQQASGRASASVTLRSHLELLATFAYTGLVPWWADARQPDLIEIAIKALVDNKPTALRQLLDWLSNHPTAVGRLVNHLPEPVLIRWLGAMLPPAYSDEQAELPSLLLEQLPQVKRPQRTLAWAVVLTQLGQPKIPFAAPVEFWQTVLVRLALALQTTYTRLIRQLNQTVSNGAHASSLLAQTIKTLYAELPAGEGANVSRAAAPDSAAQRRLATAIPAGQSADRTRQRDDISAPQSPVSIQPVEEIYVDNAGLVILWPFLARFFGYMDLLADTAFKDEDSQQRAVGLLQYLATGLDEWPEYLLPLNKLLCGLPLDALFAIDLPLTVLERDESDSLLRSVVAQAPVLGEMSIDGLRGSFLLRAGILRSQDGAWLLQVEHETYDLVLDQVPWRWDWVKLPWMELPMRVEWLT